MNFKLATDRQAPANFYRMRNFLFAIKGKPSYSRTAIRVISLALVSTILSMASSALAVLQLGDRGTPVTILQERLTATGNFQGPISGFFDRFTETAVIRFQQANGLLVNGIVDSQTQAALDRQFGIDPIQTYNPITNSRIFKRGDSGVDVENIQRRLQAVGYYNGPLTGYFGDLTKQATIRFQQNRELPPNGIVDSVTLAALSGVREFPEPNRGNFINTGDRTIQIGSIGTDVSDLQRHLISLGYYNGPISGDFDRVTEAAVIRFQEDNRLYADGIVGPRTWVALSEPPVQPSPPSPPPTYTPPNPPLAEAPPAARYSILDLQKRLKEKGFYNGPLDGIFGAATQTAVEAAQRRYGISPNDILLGRF